MNDPNSLTSAWQQDETSKEAGDNSMAVKPWCGDPDISKSPWRREEPMMKARLPEFQTDTGGSHPLLTPDKEQHPYGVRSIGCAGVNNHRDGAGHTPDNGRTGHLRAHDHKDTRTTGSPKQESMPVWRRSLHITQGTGLTPGASGVTSGRVNGITIEQSKGNPRSHGGRETVRIPRSNLKRRTTNVDR